MKLPSLRPVVLDDEQDKVLRDVADIIGRAHAARELKSLRRIAVLGLTTWRLFAPSNYARWNAERTRGQRAA